MRVPALGRKQRSPATPFNIKTRAFAIQPFAIMPVLPGDTLKKASVQMRAVTDPVKSALTGWWADVSLFYVKLRDISPSGEIENMALVPTYSATAIDSATDKPKEFFQGGTLHVPWLRYCMTSIVDTYFRDEEEDASTYVNDDGDYVGALISKSAMDSATLGSTMLEAGNDVELTVGGDDKITGEEIRDTLTQYEWMSMNGLTDQTYEEFLASYGVKSALVEEKSFRPELLRFWRQWTLPVNHVEPSTGVPSTAVSWVLNGTADKSRFFKEPGFIVGIVCFRPKVYYKNWRGSLTALMNDIYTWLPPALDSDPTASFKKVNAANGIFEGVTDDVIVDMRDLLMYGEQFTNQDLSTDVSASMPTVALPTTANQRFYPDAALEKQLFTTAASAYYIRADGLLQVEIASRVVDNYPTRQTLQM